jgi:chitin synthase
MLAAFFEWFLWLSAFLYCLFKVYRKAENTSTRVLAILMAIVFTLLRYDGQWLNIMATDSNPPERSSFPSWSSLYRYLVK